MDTLAYKSCSKCKQSKLTSDFSRSKHCKDGLHPTCKACVKQSYAQNRERILAQAREHYAENQEIMRERNRTKWQRHGEKYRERKRQLWHENPELAKEKNHEYYYENQERLLAQKRDYYAENQEIMRERNRTKWQRHGEKYNYRNRQRWQANREHQRQRYQKNPSVRQIYRHRRRARIHGNGGSFTTQEWQALKAQYEYRCLRCGESEPEIKLTVDHVVPISKGGSNDITNIQPLCKPCNSAKGTKTIDYR